MSSWLFFVEDWAPSPGIIAIAASSKGVLAVKSTTEAATLRMVMGNARNPAATPTFPNTRP